MVKNILALIYQKEYKNVELPVFKQTKEWLNLCFNGQKPDFISFGSSSK